jgi:uncharacterized protein with HEPN domain
MSFDQFRADDRTIDAVIRNFLVIGEATRHVPQSVRDQSPNAPWALMERTRHVLVHDYETVRLDIVWKTLTDDLPPLVEPLQLLLRAARCSRSSPLAPQNTISANETWPDGVMWKSFTLRARMAVEAP